MALYQEAGHASNTFMILIFICDLLSAVVPYKCRKKNGLQPGKGEVETYDLHCFGRRYAGLSDFRCADAQLQVYG